MNFDKEHNQIEAPSPAVSPRRQLLSKAGLLAGGAVLSGSLFRQAKAQAPAANPPIAPGDLSPGATPANPPGSTMAVMDPMEAMNSLPATARIKQVETAGVKEQNDVAILNYALTLEFLEADFYNRVVEADNARSYLQGRPKDFARVLSRDENTHVLVVTDAIRKLGGTPVEKPEFQFPQNAFISQIAFLTLSATLEETGVSAYLGQGGNVRRKDVLNFAATIYGNEARHTAMIRYLLGDTFAPRDMEEPLTMAQVLERVRPFIVGGAAVTSS